MNPTWKSGEGREFRATLTKGVVTGTVHPTLPHSNESEIRKEGINFHTNYFGYLNSVFIFLMGRRST